MSAWDGFERAIAERAGIAPANVAAGTLRVSLGGSTAFVTYAERGGGRKLRQLRVELTPADVLQALQAIERG